MNYLGLALIALGCGLVAFDGVRTADLLRMAKIHDAGSLTAIKHLSDRNLELERMKRRFDGIEQALYQPVTVPPFKPQEESRFAIRDFKDRDDLGRMFIPDTNPHTGRPIIYKWTAIEDIEGCVLYGPKYPHKSKSTTNTQ